MSQNLRPRGRPRLAFGSPGPGPLRASDRPTDRRAARPPQACAPAASRADGTGLSVPAKHSTQSTPRGLGQHGAAWRASPSPSRTCPPASGDLESTWRPPARTLARGAHKPRGMADCPGPGKLGPRRRLVSPSADWPRDSAVSSRRTSCVLEDGRFPSRQGRGPGSARRSPGSPRVGPGPGTEDSVRCCSV